MRNVLVAFIAIIFLVACGSGSAGTDAADSAATSALSRVADRKLSPVQDPRALYVVGCGGQSVVPGEEPGQCVLVVAGGKRFLFGAPAGVAMTLSLEDLRQLDAVFLFSLASKDIEGLDEIRRASWASGRSGELWVYGPEGIGETVLLLDQIHLYGDAMATMDTGARGFRDLPLRAFAFRLVDLAQGAGPLMDVGDVIIEGRPRDGLRVGYRLVYRGPDGESAVAIETCPAPAVGAGALVTRDVAMECGTPISQRITTASRSTGQAWQTLRASEVVKIDP